MVIVAKTLCFLIIHSAVYNVQSGGISVHSYRAGLCNRKGFSNYGTINIGDILLIAGLNHLLETVSG